MHYSLKLRNQICTVSANEKQGLEACNMIMTMQLEFAEIEQ